MRYNGCMDVLVDTSTMHAMNKTRGVGVYAANLIHALKNVPSVHLVEKKPDIVHYPFFDLFFRTLPIRKSVKTVITIHDVIPLVFPDRYLPGIKGTLRHYVQRLSLRSVNAVITDSENSKRDIVKYLHYPKERVHVVYLAGDPQMKKQPPSVIGRAEKTYGLPEEYILYVGDMNYNKNLPKFIEAFAMLPKQYHLVMVGSTLKNTDIPEGRWLHQSILKEKVADRVHLLTNVPREPVSDLAAIFTKARAYVQPSLYEGFGLSVLDAMQCETPVACSDASSLKEVAGAAAVYFDPWHVKDMAAMIKRTVGMNGSEKAQLKQKMKQNAARFSWKKTAEETAAVYAEVLGV